MLRIFFVCAGLALFAVPAFAYQSRCVEPYAPVVPDPRAASKQQLDAVKKDVVQFIKDSDQYQECLLLELKTEKQTASRKQKPFDPQIDADIQKMISANQREKERVGATYNGAVHTWHALQKQ
ncbi:MAG: hypothetical protein ACT4OG_07665 [Alphaproteobacteria bacterium]